MDKEILIYQNGFKYNIYTVYSVWLMSQADFLSKYACIDMFQENKDYRHEINNCIMICGQGHQNLSYLIISSKIKEYITKYLCLYYDTNVVEYVIHCTAYIAFDFGSFIIVDTPFLYIC